MILNVLIVDDSVVFRSQIKNALAAIPNLEVVGTAANGRIALAKLSQLSVDLVTLDYEMPEMNGLETIVALRKAGFRARIIVFSSMTPKGASVALEALRCGADDVIAKPVSSDLSMENAAAMIGAELVPKVLQFMNSDKAQSRPEIEESIPEKPVAKTQVIRKNVDRFMPELIVIGSSTGGPNALENIFSKIKAPIRIPILIAQHMPPVFTKCLADRLQDLTGIEANEAIQMEPLKNNRIYVAPGNYHMSLVRTNDLVKVRLDQGPPQNMVRPAVDPLFDSASAIYGDKCMAFVLTGMGADGCRGSRALKSSGSGVMIQSRESCIVFGMPGAVFEADAYDKIGSLEEIQKTIQKMVMV